jgi:hypothetical protein
MVWILAYRVQEQASASLSKPIRARLCQLARAIETNPKCELTASHSYKPGTRLVREWRNKVHVVEVEQQGYRYAGSRYESLSEIARLITGTRWSGPLFFGLKKPQTKEGKEVA